MPRSSSDRFKSECLLDQGGAEAAVHAARRLAKEFGNDPGKIMLKVDFSNAFNMDDRTGMIGVPQSVSLG